ncbi:hypothetical protein TPHA_0E01210 [Tetrapisispora phaffii CBS 4417]|uniref:Uncharacterized protein n=1 Tax=Tetrapisispora phaffii (strain ATCC 24235 / CBS 4417 / NBRC 1672 / NRRL Y-8282 / UCD 70-5) TaxID=1071381 RepID=G8BTI8_TETPH|nr:hypothetical protein TPHA_0E01210 [Tetrapisispora phaffii CBS 4417]CCE63216.1 hypothetical protein TPHA_0E01210 [Tetrapisispora phaffii CBS 4417]
MLVDLNVKWPQEDFSKPITNKDLATLKETLQTLHVLGYTHIALNFTVSHSNKFSNNVNELNPIKVKERFGDFMKQTGMKIYSRVTLVIDDPSKGQSLSKISQAYDIIAAMPISEKGVTLATTGLDVDLLTFDFGSRLPVFLKHKSICSCVKRGVKLEIVYGYALRDTQARRQFISNVRSVIRSSRSRGIVISSGAQNSLECRNIIGVTALIKSMGLESDKCTRAMGDLASLVLLNGRLRNKSYKQTVVVGGEITSDVVNDIEKIDDVKLLKIVKRSRDDSRDDEFKNNKKTKI